MYYTIKYEHKYDDVYEIIVDVKEDDNIIVHGKTAICVPDIEEDKTVEDYIKNYAENIFLVNLKDNIPQIKSLVLPCDDGRAQ